MVESLIQNSVNYPKPNLDVLTDKIIIILNNINYYNTTINYDNDVVLHLKIVHNVL